ncbi:MAG TPA: hypothetical protein VIV06_10810 [Candidatus Limnocylindrales bacterium]
MATTLISRYPALRVLRADGSFAQFVGGKLVVEDDDPDRDRLLAFAAGDPSVQIIVDEVQCLHCGEVIGAGRGAAGRLAMHVKAVHPEVWEADANAEHARMIAFEAKARAGISCDVCNPVQTFAEPEQLALHVQLVHTAPPPMDEQGNTLGAQDEPDGRPVEDVAVPAAKRKG